MHTRGLHTYDTHRNNNTLWRLLRAFSHRLSPTLLSFIRGRGHVWDRGGSGLHRRKKEGAELLEVLKTNLKRNHKIRDVCLWRLMRPETKLCLHGSSKHSSPISDASWERWRRRARRGGGADPAVITGRLQEGALVSRGRSLRRSVFQGCSTLLPCNGSPKLMSTVAPTGGGFISAIALPGSEISKRGES